jgi:hypothetical protein
MAKDDATDSGDGFIAELRGGWLVVLAGF